MIILSIACLALNCPQIDYRQELIACATAELLAVPGFRMESTSNIRGEDFEIDGRRHSDYARLSIRLLKLDRESDSPRFWDRLMPQLVYTKSYAGFSEFPIGTNTRRYASGGGNGLDTYEGTYFVQIQTAYKGSGARGNVTWNATDREGDKVACEGLARRCLARLQNLDARTASNVTVGAASLPSVQGSRGDRLVPLSAYCAARNVALSVNQRQGTASFTANGRLVVVPLAAHRIKAGSQWYDSNDISILRNGQWYVPLTAIEGAYHG